MITFTPEAVEQWQREHPEPLAAGGHAVRISLVSGGCAGLKYVLEAVAGPGEGDHVFAQPGSEAVSGGLAVYCPAGDLPRLDGLRVDYVDAMVGGGYRFENPNAGRSCGCGASFADPLA